MEKFISKSVNETEEFAADVAKRLKNGDIIAYKGGLGVGKTAFTRGLAKGLSLDCEVTSPTFSLVHEYRYGMKGSEKSLSLFHFDMYRVDNINDLYSTGFFDYLDENQIIAVEWSENIQSILEQEGECVITITIKALDENTREILIEGGDRF